MRRLLMCKLCIVGEDNNMSASLIACVKCLI